MLGDGSLLSIQFTQAIIIDELEVIRNGDFSLSSVYPDSFWD